MTDQACRCGCGRLVAADEGRRWQVEWLNATAEPGDGAVLVQRSVAHTALSHYEDAVRSWGCTAVLGDAGVWRERWDIATDQASRAGLLSSGDPEERRRQLEEMDRQAKIDERRATLWRMDMRPHGEAGYVYTTPTDEEVRTAEAAVIFARSKLEHSAPYIARRLPRPVQIRWFTERHAPHVKPDFWQRPARGFVWDAQRAGPLYVCAGQGAQLPRVVAHELYHAGQPRSASFEHHDDQERDARQFEVEFLADWQANGLDDPAVRERFRVARLSGRRVWPV